MPERECKCPPYVVKCAHYGELVVWMLSPDSVNDWNRRIQHGRCPACADWGDENEWHVYGPGSVDPRPSKSVCLVGGALLWEHPMVILDPYRDSEKDAEGHFNARVDLLLSIEPLS